MSECIFCKIFAGEIESRKIYEDKDILGVMDIQPLFAQGQCLVIPRRHVAQFYELEDDEIAQLFKAAKVVANKIKKAFNPPFVSMFSRGQTIPHAHVILFPSSSETIMEGLFASLRFYRTLLQETSDIKLDEIAEKIRNA